MSKQEIETTQYPQIIEQLKLEDYYPKKITREKALEVTNNYVSTDDLTDPGKIPWFILQNLIRSNYKGRCFKVKWHRPIENTLSILQTRPDETNCDELTEATSPADALIALFWCCDDFLRQILVEKMAMCQLAIPLFLPIDYKPFGSELLLWAMSTVKKQCETYSGSLIAYPLSNVSAIRLGRPRISKSRILNYVISHLKHDIFFQSECNGGRIQRKIADGLMEMTWYFPNGEKDDFFSEALTFMNLRGNASRLKGNIAIISQISMTTIVFMPDNDLMKEDVDFLFKTGNGNLIFVVNRELENDLRHFLVIRKKRNTAVVLYSGKSESEISEEIRCSVRRMINGNERHSVPKRSINMLLKVIEKKFHVDKRKSEFSNEKMKLNKTWIANIEGMQYIVDEDTLKFNVAKFEADKILKILKKAPLPLQNIAIEIGERERELYRLKPTQSMQNNKYVENVQSDIRELRNKQKTKWGAESSVLELFRMSDTNSPAMRYFHSYVKIILDLNSIGTTYNNMNLEYYIREIGQVYEMESQLEEVLTDLTRQFPVIAAKMLLNGHPLELMYADASYVPLTWIDAVLSSLRKQIDNAQIFVLSVLGVEKSGKSTMLNAMFGLQFAVSVGQSTKGVFAQLLHVNESLKQSTDCDYILVVDTEGLRTPATATTVQGNHDNELATFVIGLSDVTIINIMGENATEMQDILKIAVHAFIKMDNVNINPSCIFVHQNITDVAASDRNTTQKLKLKQLLDDLTKSAAKIENRSEKYQRFSDVIHFQENKHVMYVSSLWKGDPPMAPPNPGYCRTVLQVKNQIIELMHNSNVISLEDFKCRLSNLWKAILRENVLFSLKNTNVQASNDLQSEESYLPRTEIVDTSSKESSVYTTGESQLTITINSVKIEPTQYPPIIEELKLKDYYPKKLTREKALEVTDNYVSTDDLNDDPGKIPWFILQNLIMCNYEGRCFKVRWHRPIVNTLSILQTRPDETNCDEMTEATSPADALIALFWCCDDILRQILVEKLAMCQLAIPLFLPITYKPFGSELLLWAMSTVKKQCETYSGSLTAYPLSNVSAIRLGRPRISKSRILNYVISHLKHDIFFQYECNGGTLQRKIADGLMEMTWYFPNGEKDDFFSEALTFMNLRGNASRLKGNIAIISQISLATIVFMPDNDLMKEDVDFLFKTGNGHLIFVVNRELENDLRQFLVMRKNRNIALVIYSGKSESEISEEIRCSVRRMINGNKRHIVPKRSINMLPDVIGKKFHGDEKKSEFSNEKIKVNETLIANIEGMQYIVDEETLKYIVANFEADKILTVLKKAPLPLQNIAIEIGERERELFRLKPTQSMQNDKYVENVQSDKIRELRNKQKTIWDEESSVLQLFKMSDTDSPAMRYFYSYVKVILDLNSTGTTYNKMNLEYYIREIGQVYEMESQLEEVLTDLTRQFPVIAAKMLLNGHPLELMYADASYVPLTWIDAVLSSLRKQINNAQIFVLSVLGVENSGKSTMLNAMFGLQFAVSVGQGTKGVFAQLLHVNESLKQITDCDYILVVDTEGLRNPATATTVQRNHDNELATFVIGLSDVTIINIMGENATEMQEFLKIAVHAFIKMDNVNINPSCIFVHQNITDVAASDKNTTQKRKLRELLDDHTKSAAKIENRSEKYQRFSDVIHFQENKHVMYVSSLWKGDTPMAPPNPGYSRTVFQVKKQVIDLMHLNISLEEFKSRLSELWKAILNENVVFSPKNTTVQVFNTLQSKEPNKPLTEICDSSSKKSSISNNSLISSICSCFREIYSDEDCSTLVVMEN